MRCAAHESALSLSQCCAYLLTYLPAHGQRLYTSTATGGHYCRSAALRVAQIAAGRAAAAAAALLHVALRLARLARTGDRLRCAPKLGEDLADEMILVGGQLRLVLAAFGQLLFALHIGHLAEDQAMPQIVRQHQIARKTVCERLIEIEDLKQLVALDRMKIAIGERSHVSRRLADRRVLPELVAEHVALA